MRRFVISITPNRATAVGLPARVMVAACERCNYDKESPGWQVRAGEDEKGVHTTEFVTPTGARYRSSAPAAPGRTVIDISEVEMRIGIAIARHTA